MKLLIFATFFFIALMGSFPSLAESTNREALVEYDYDDSIGPKNNISLDFLGAFVGGYTLRYERKIFSFMSVTVPFEIQTFTFAPWKIQIQEALKEMFPSLNDLSLLMGAGVKFQFLGWYAEPIMKLGFARFDYRGNVGTRYAAAFEPGLRLGKEWLFAYGLSLDLGLGAYTRFYAPKNMPNLLPKIDINFGLGYSW